MSTENLKKADTEERLPHESAPDFNFFNNVEFELFHTPRLRMTVGKPIPDEVVRIYDQEKDQTTIAVVSSQARSEVTTPPPSPIEAARTGVFGAYIVRAANDVYKSGRLFHP